jgi:hypothetical protein
MKGTLLLRTKQFFVHISASHCVGVTELHHMPLPAHALGAVQVTLKSASNEGQFTTEDETVFRPYLPSNCIGVNEISNMALRTHALRAMQVTLKSVSKKGLFTLEVQSVLRPPLPSHCSGVNEI